MNNSTKIYMQSNMLQQIIPIQYYITDIHRFNKWHLALIQKHTDSFILITQKIFVYIRFIT